MVHSADGVTLHLKQIKIKDFKKWSEMKTDEDMSDVTKDVENNIAEATKINNRMTQRKMTMDENVLRMD